MSEFSRETLLNIIETDHVQCGEASALARMALAAMDSEPVAYMYDGEDGTEYNGHNEFSGGGKGIPLYRHAQPVLEIESEPVFTLEVAREDYKGQKLGNHFGFITLDAARELKEGNYQLYTAQPAPVVPDGYVMVPKEPTDEMLAAAKEWTGLTSTAEVVYIKMLAASPQPQNAPQNIPEIIPGWIPVSERMPEMGEKQRYVLAADFKNNYWPNIPNTQVGVYGDWFDDGNPTWDDGDGEDLHLKEVTHWMPLPAGPQGVKGE
ncbi:DUF551 domain-containing protein [Klebsiella pneumoniae]